MCVWSIQFSNSVASNDDELRVMSGGVPGRAVRGYRLRP